MASKDWDDIITSDDCIPVSEYNEMVTYIKCPTQSLVTFTMYSTCTSGAASGQEFKFSYDDDDSIFEGGATTGDDLILKANTADTYPFITLEGNAEIYLDVANEEEILFREGTAQFFKFDRTGSISQLYGGALDDESLFIYANSNDNCPVMEMYGDSGVSYRIKHGSIFEISTCSDEKLFEIDSGAADMHVDFHCLDAHNFVLELRTSDPSSPTCTGQIWFRTDLV